jgi:hypothetical protein
MPHTVVKPFTLQLSGEQLLTAARDHKSELQKAFERESLPSKGNVCTPGQHARQQCQI